MTKPKTKYWCAMCNDTGYYGDNGPGIEGNVEFHACDQCTVSERCMRTHNQNCANCEAFDCGDNVNTIGKEELNTAKLCAETMGAPREHKEVHKVQAIENTSNMTCIKCWSKTGCDCEPVKVEPPKTKDVMYYNCGGCDKPFQLTDLTAYDNALGDICEKCYYGEE